MINALKLGKNHTRLAGYAVFILSLVFRIALTENDFQTNLGTDKTIFFVNVSLVLMAIGLFMVAFSMLKSQSTIVDEIRIKADRVEFLCL